MLLIKDCNYVKEVILKKYLNNFLISFQIYETTKQDKQ